MIRSFRFILALPLVAACTSGDADPSPGDADGGNAGFADANPNCPDPSLALPEGYRPVASVSRGNVSSTQGGGVTSTMVDASAGGFGNSTTEPFVYVDFTGGGAARVDVNDTASFSDTTWDLGFKRYVIRTNGGDSGPAEVEVARVAAASIGDVNQAPGSGFGADDWLSANCLVSTDALGAPLTRFSDWFNADGGNLTPNDNVYVVKLHDGSSIKLEVVTYSDGMFQLDWAAL